MLRQHAEEGAYVVDGVTRSFQPFDPFCLRWEFPVWTPAPELDPAELRQEKRAPPKKKAEPPTPDWTPASFVDEFLSAEPLNRAAIIAKAAAAGVSARKSGQLLNAAEAVGLAFKWIIPGTQARSFATNPQENHA